jgi:hypothetical protein
MTKVAEAATVKNDLQNDYRYQVTPLLLAFG